MFIAPDIVAALFKIIGIKYMQENYGESMVKNAFEGKTNNIVLSIVYSPKINIFRETVSLQFEILYYK